jgi:hypothetical protein
MTEVIMYNNSYKYSTYIVARTRVCMYARHKSACMHAIMLDRRAQRKASEVEKSKRLMGKVSTVPKEEIQYSTVIPPTLNLAFRAIIIFNDE